MMTFYNVSAMLNFSTKLCSAVTEKAMGHSAFVYNGAMSISYGS